MSLHRNVREIERSPAPGFPDIFPDIFPDNLKMQQTPGHTVRSVLRESVFYVHFS